jgi:hypothetical protein
VVLLFYDNDLKIIKGLIQEALITSLEIFEVVVMGDKN